MGVPLELPLTRYSGSFSSGPWLHLPSWLHPPRLKGAGAKNVSLSPPSGFSDYRIIVMDASGRQFQVSGKK